MDTSTSAARIRSISVARWFDPLLATIVAAGTYFFLYERSISDVLLTLIIVLAVSAYYVASELSRARWIGTAIPDQSFRDVLSNTLTRFIGILLGIAGMLFCYWLFPEYARDSYQTIFAEAIPWTLAVILPLSFFVLLFTEYRLGGSRDGTYEMGLFAQLRFSAIDWGRLRDGILEWLIRVIFLTINFSAGYILLARIRDSGLPAFGGDIVSTVIRFDTIVFALIIFTILPGYLFASRLIATQVRRVDRTWFGWAITMSSYSPINAAVFTAWISYRPQTDVFGDIPAWAAIGAAHPVLLYGLAATILVAGLFHLWGEATMGVRSANLSLRGIITTGPFAFTKHPVYVSKCVQWGVIYLPFLNAVGVLDGLRSGLLFLLVCAVFAGRALAEERLLATDKDYVDYARYMDDHGVFSFVGRVLPFMTFTWRYDYWQRHAMLQRD